MILPVLGCFFLNDHRCTLGQALTVLGVLLASVIIKLLLQIKGILGSFLHLLQIFHAPVLASNYLLDRSRAGERIRPFVSREIDWLTGLLLLA